MPCIGNHDNGPGEGDTANYNQIFALPRSQGTYGSGTEDYYYFTYGNAIFAVLSTETFKGGAVPFATQADWLERLRRTAHGATGFRNPFLASPPLADMDRFRPSAPVQCAPLSTDDGTG